MAKSCQGGGIGPSDGFGKSIFHGINRENAWTEALVEPLQMLQVGLELGERVDGFHWIILLRGVTRGSSQSF
ncbi:hypothetical protein CUJ89_17560 [Burkholderia pyrrocinia]|uniref:Uncharacterized protein n=1 Tax=Burkholderia pyrrocinia TaxID=60550 RepID=A0A2Z5MXM3_BURPY|nr:hypothetical protein CUJ89_17560 [Burkholderia pyrrocinia]